MTLTVWVSYTGSVSSYGKCPYLLESQEPPSFQAGVIPIQQLGDQMLPSFFEIHHHHLLLLPLLLPGFCNAALLCRANRGSGGGWPGAKLR